MTRFKDCPKCGKKFEDSGWGLCDHCYYKQEIKKEKKYYREYFKKNPCKHHTMDCPLDYVPSQNANARKPISPLTQKRLFQRDGFICKHCGCTDVEQLSIDHIIPVSAGGTNDLENLQVLCRKCNSSKGRKCPVG